MPESLPHAVASTAARPDLDWSQVRETLLMLGLAVAQIESAMKDSHESVDVLTHSFTAMFGNAQVIADAAKDLPPGATRQLIEENCTLVSARMQEAIVAFQFYDRMAKRLSHVSHSVDGLAELISDNRRLYSPHEWVGMQQRIRAENTMEEERVMFDAILQGMSVQQALAQYREMRAQASKTADEVELF